MFTDRRPLFLASTTYACNICKYDAIRKFPCPIIDKWQMPPPNWSHSSIHHPVCTIEVFEGGRERRERREEREEREREEREEREIVDACM